MKELSVFHYKDGFGFQVIVVGGVLIDNLFHYVWHAIESFEEEVHQFSASYGVSCLPGECFEVADILIDMGEFELKLVEGGLGCFLFRRICILLFESR